MRGKARENGLRISKHSFKARVLVLFFGGEEKRMKMSCYLYNRTIHSQPE
jgi:hypothetical protein